MFKQTTVAESTADKLLPSFMPRFYIPTPLEIGSHLALPEAVAHHVQVLRLTLGAPVTLFNGSGGEFTASIVSVEKTR